MSPHDFRWLSPAHIFANNSIDPLLHRVVRLTSNESVRLFADTIRTGQKSLPFYQLHVDVLLISVSRFTDDITTIISACTGVAGLGLWISEYEAQAPKLQSWPLTLNDEVIALLGSGPLRPSRLSISLPLILNNVAFDFPSSNCFSNLTHIELMPEFMEDLLAPDALQLLCRLRVTHLSLYQTTKASGFTAFLNKILEHINPSVCVIVLFCDVPVFRLLGREGMDGMDLRVVLACFEHWFSQGDTGSVPKEWILWRSAELDTYTTDFGYSPTGALDLWERAEQIIGMRQARDTRAFLEADDFEIDSSPGHDE